jgi:hypothetical protein
MRIGYAMAIAAFLAAAPAMADVTISTGHGDSARHEYSADRDRDAGRQHMRAAHEEADRGNYGNAEAHREAAHEDWHAAHRQEHAADHDRDGGVTLRIGH